MDDQGIIFKDLKQSQIQGTIQREAAQAAQIDAVIDLELQVGSCGTGVGAIVVAEMVNTRGKPTPSGRRTTSCPKLVRLRHMKLGWSGNVQTVCCDLEVISLTNILEKVYRRAVGSL